MRRLFFFLCLPCTLFAFSTPNEASSYVVLDARTGKALDEKAKDESLYPASCTKIATLLYILKKTPDLPLQDKVVVPKEAVGVVSPQTKAKKDWTAVPSYVLESDGATAGLMAGEILPLQDLLYALMLPSGNDAANALAYYWGGRSIETFVGKLNEFVVSEGVKNTHFCNPHGLPHPQHVSTAYDLAFLTKKGLEIPLFKEIVHTYAYTKQKTNKNKNSVVWYNHNKLLKKGPFYLEEAIGVKTGYHQRAQHCLVAAAENTDRTLILVILKHPDRSMMFKQAKTLLREYLNEKALDKELVSAGDLKLSFQVPGYADSIPVKAVGAPFSARYFPSEKPLFEAKVHWKTMFPPLTEQDEVGSLELYRDGQLLTSLALVPSHNVSPTLSTRFYQLEEYCKSHGATCAFIILAGCCIIGFGVYFFFRKR